MRTRAKRKFGGFLSKGLPPRLRHAAKWKNCGWKRPLVTPSEMEKICSAAFQPAFSEGKVVESGKGKALANAQEFSDFIKLMSMSGRNGYSHRRGEGMPIVPPK